MWRDQKITLIYFLKAYNFGSEKDCRKNLILHMYFIIEEMEARENKGQIGGRFCGLNQLL